jgi:hypothetical protein
MADPLPLTYQTRAGAYYERFIPITAVRAIYEHIPINAKILAELKPDVDKLRRAADLIDIGYQTAFG